MKNLLPATETAVADDILVRYSADDDLDGDNSFLKGASSGNEEPLVSDL
jgi:hypothetical protein